MNEWTLEQIEASVEKKETVVIYFYTPLCGTCAVAKKMITVVEALLPTLPLGMSNMNYVVPLSHRWEMESVPCLLFLKNGELMNKIYAFHSVEHIYNECKKYV